MALTTSYLTSTKNVNAFFDSIIGAKAPDAFTQKFIEGLGFKSTNDRIFISVLKGLGFLDQSAAPTEIYFKFLDQSESKKILAEAIEQAYGDLFSVKKDANELQVADVKNKLKTLTLGKYSDDVISKMAMTFKALCEYADWTSKKPTGDIEKPPSPKPSGNKAKDGVDSMKKDQPEDPETEPPFGGGKKPDFHYNIQIHLPDSRDEAVYDAIFKSLKKHLF